MSPSFRNMNESFEGWAYRRGLLPQVHRLEAAGFLERRETGDAVGLFVKITEAGRLRALGGRNPEREWSAPWDGKWHLVLFDLPAKERALRRKLLRVLVENGCGCLQGSVWISARKPSFFKSLKGNHDCRRLLCLETDSRGSKSNREMVDGAWNFSRINANYRSVMDHLARLSQTPKDKAGLLEWSRKENEAWLAAVAADPMLPAALLPKDYLGRRAWRARKTALSRAARLASKFEYSIQ